MKLVKAAQCRGNRQQKAQGTAAFAAQQGGGLDRNRAGSQQHAVLQLFHTTAQGGHTAAGGYHIIVFTIEQQVGGLAAQGGHDHNAVGSRLGGYIYRSFLHSQKE